MKLFLIRHTSLQVPSGICYGQSDIDVASSFMNEALVTQQKLISSPFDAIYASPLQRCLKLANTLNLGEPMTDNRLMELNFGDWEMSAWDDIPRDFKIKSIRTRLSPHFKGGQNHCRFSW